MTRTRTPLFEKESQGGGLRSYLDDALAPLGKIESKRVFGLHGIKADGTLLGFVIDDRLFLRTNEDSRKMYVEEGGRPYSFTKHTGEFIETSYYPLPDWVYDDPDELLRWARVAQTAARDAPSARKRREAQSREAGSRNIKARRSRTRA